MSKTNKYSLPNMVLEQIQRTLGNPDQLMVDAVQKAIKTGDKAAIWHIADQHIPDDIKSFGKRHNMPAFVDEVWRSAFIAGWYAAHGAKDWAKQLDKSEHQA